HRSQTGHGIRLDWMLDAVGATASVPVARRSRATEAVFARGGPAAGQRLVDVVGVAGLLLATMAIRVQGLPGGGPVVNDEGWAIANGRYLLTLLTHPNRWETFLGLFSPGLTSNRHHV